MNNPLDLYVRKLELRRATVDRVSGDTKDVSEMCERSEPWIVYTYGRTHDRWWPLSRSTRILGRGAIGMTCAVCGERKTAVIRIKRFGPLPDAPYHSERVRFLLKHLHADRPHPAAWAQPMLNLGAHNGGVDLDLLAMRLEADLREHR
jgi:hypothetical protein